MKKFYLILIIGILISSFGFSQSKSEIGNLLDGISKIQNSKEIIKAEQTERIIEYGWRILPTLAEVFTDQTLTEIKSECHDRILKRGELAIIIADRIEVMPYFTLTGMQNCILTLCENNPNLVEYYLPAIVAQGIAEFQEKYIEWLASNDRIDWTPLLNYDSKRELRKIKRERKKAIREMQSKK